MGEGLINIKMKYLTSAMFAFFVITFSMQQITFAQIEPYAQIMGRINEDMQRAVNDKQLADKVTAILSKLNDDGSWTDINYNDVQYEPLKRIKEFALAYIRPTNKFYNDAKLYNVINLSLQNWIDRNLKNKNWWYNDISYPQSIGQTLILMRYAKKHLPKQMEETLILRMSRKLKGGDGANTSDIALHFLYRACLKFNKETLDSAVTYLYEPISITDGEEGIQVDNSYFQHGKQQAIASYGRVFVGNSVNAAYYLSGTEFALTQKKLNILVSFIKDTFLKTIRGYFYDFNVRGRGISRKDSLNGNVSEIINKLKIINPENLNYWNAAELRITRKKSASFGVLPTHNFYWKSGYTLNVRPKYTFSVQVASSRNLRTERGNNENILGKFLSDGATNIQRSGSEYANLMPIMEWDKVPGTTSRNYLTDKGPTIQKEWGLPGTSNFVGGISDGLYGVSTYKLDYDSVKAKKAWFFFYNEVVCLGAGITSNTDENVTTTLNQTWLRSKVLIGEKRRISVLDNNKLKQFYNPVWALQDSIGYFFPQGGKLNVSNQIQKGSWYRINHFQQKTEIKNNVFKMWFSHSTKPQAEKYAYIVVPGLGNANEMAKYDINKIKILSNTEDIQAVKNVALNMLQIVFYQAGTLNVDGFVINADQGCLVYIKDLNTKNPTLFVADPTQEISSISLNIKLPNQSVSKLIECKLPTGENAGSTAKFTIN